MKRQYVVTLLGILAVGIAMANDVDFTKMKPTPEMIKEAKGNPNGWVYVIEGNYGQNDEVPPHAIAGAWEVDGSGNIIEGSFRANPNYRSK